MKLIILHLVSKSVIFATGLNELNPTTLREVAQYLHPVETQVLSSSSKGLNGWSRKLVLNKVRNSEHLDRESSWKLVSSLIAEVETHFSDVPIYPITLTFNQDDVPSLKELDVVSFIRRVQTVVFEGSQRMVISASHSETTIGSSEWHYGMSDPNVWVWEQPTSLSGILSSETITAVNTLDLKENSADLVMELSWFVSGGDINWTTMKKSRVRSVKREGVYAEEILLNQKLRNIQTLKLSEFDRSVLVNVSVLANLENLESLDLCQTKVVDISALAQLTTLKTLTLYRAELLDISTFPELKDLESLDLSWTKVVDVSALAKVTNLKALDLAGAKLLDISTLPELKNLESLNMSWTKVLDVSAFAKLPNLKSLKLSDTNVVDVSALAKLTKLESLCLAWTKVVDVSSLAELTNLKSLTLRQTNVDVSALKQKLPKLEVIQ